MNQRQDFLRTQYENSIKALAWEQGYRQADLEWRHIYDGHPVEEGGICPECTQGNPYADKEEMA